MAVWQLIFIILAVVLLIFVIAWYAGLNEKMADMVKKISDLL
jgi:hypothetical protein